MSAVSETYVTDPADDGEAALRRERAAAQAAEAERAETIRRNWIYVAAWEGREIDVEFPPQYLPPDELAETLLRYRDLTPEEESTPSIGVFTRIEGTDQQQRAFAAKMAEWRRTDGIPGYTGPRAAR